MTQVESDLHKIFGWTKHENKDGAENISSKQGSDSWLQKTKWPKKLREKSPDRLQSLVWAWRPWGSEKGVPRQSAIFEYEGWINYVKPNYWHCSLWAWRLKNYVGWKCHRRTRSEITCRTRMSNKSHSGKIIFCR